MRKLSLIPILPQPLNFSAAKAGMASIAPRSPASRSAIRHGCWKTPKPCRPPGGVTPALEILINPGTVRKMIEENRLDKLGAAIETGTEDGMQSFNQALYQLVKDGKISQKDALAKASNGQALEMMFKGIFLDEGRRILG